MDSSPKSWGSAKVSPAFARPNFSSKGHGDLSLTEETALYFLLPGCVILSKLLNLSELLYIGKIWQPVIPALSTSSNALQTTK